MDRELSYPTFISANVGFDNSHFYQVADGGSSRGYIWLFSAPVVNHPKELFGYSHLQLPVVFQGHK